MLKIKSSIFRISILEISFIILGIISLIYYRVIWMNSHYYLFGAPVWDTGFFGHLISNASIQLRNPNVIPSESYYDTHISPAIAIYSLISPFKSFSQPIQLGIFIGICQSIVFPLNYFSIKENFNLKNKWIILVSVYIFSFLYTGLSEPERLVQFPHFEVIIPSLISLSLFFFIRRKNKLAIISALIAFTFREDAGIHLGFLYLTLYFYFYFQLKRFNNNKINLKQYKNFSYVLSLLGFSFSGISIIVQKIYFTSDNAFMRVYSGENFYSHLSFHFLKLRFNDLLNLQAVHDYWLIIPLILSISAFLLTRNLLFIIGYISCIPWFLVHITAVSPMAGLLDAHYGFPFLIGTLFPIVCINSEIDTNKIILKNKYLFPFFILTSVMIYTINLDYINKHLVNIPIEYKLNTNKGIEKINANYKELKDNGVLFSNPIISFNPNLFHNKDVAIWQVNNINPQDVNGVIYLKGSYIEAALMNFINQIFPSYPKDSVSCTIQKDSNLMAIIRKSSFKKLNFICNQK